MEASPGSGMRPGRPANAAPRSQALRIMKEPVRAHGRLGEIEVRDRYSLHHSLDQASNHRSKTTTLSRRCRRTSVQVKSCDFREWRTRAGLANVHRLRSSPCLLEPRTKFRPTNGDASYFPRWERFGSHFGRRSSCGIRQDARSRSGAPALVVRAQNVPGRMLAVGGLQHRSRALSNRTSAQ